MSNISANVMKQMSDKVGLYYVENKRLYHEVMSSNNIHAISTNIR